MLDPSTTSKEWWKIARSQLGVDKIKNVPPLIINDKIIINDIKKCECFNEYFVKECSSHIDPIKLSASIDSLNILSDNLVDSYEPLEMFIITPSDVNNILKSVDINKANGPDGISNRILKICNNQLSEPLALVFNFALKTGKYPSEWKNANLIPIFKKGDRQLMKNYRPVSLLSQTSKIFERIIYNKIYDHCKINNILTEKNSGFKKLDSTINQLIHFSHKIYQGLEDEEKIGIIFLDISKAFDSIWHKGLVFKLRKYGIKGSILKLIESYLSGRKQRVVIDGFLSEFLEIFCGVPQGSILGPLLFLIFLNDIVDNIDSIMSLFADDTALASIRKTWFEVETDLNKSLIKLQNWSENWHLNFNADKTFYMMISNNRTKKDKQEKLNLLLSNSPIKKISEHKHLGVIFNEGLTWSNHINYTCGRASKSLGLLYKNRKCFNRATLIKLYFSMIRPIIEYGSILYDNLTLSDEHRLENLQRRAALICTGALPRSES